MRAVRALAARGRDWLENLGPADPADEDAVRIGGEDDAHGVVVGRENRFPRASAQCRDGFWIGAADADIDLHRIETKIKQYAASIFIAQCVAVRAEFGQFGAAVHGTMRSRETQRDPMVPGFLRRRFRGDRAQLRDRNKANSAAPRYGADLVRSLNEGHRFARVARELGDRTEGTEAEACFGVGELTGEKRDQLFAHWHPFSPCFVRYLTASSANVHCGSLSRVARGIKW